MEAAALAISSLAVETPAPDGPDEMLTVEEAAGEIRRSPAFVRQQCKFGAIKALRDGHGWRIRRSALATYERKRTA